MSQKNIFHKPVLLQEAIKFLDIRPGEKYIDATLGGGGHAAAILKKGGFVLGIDQDPEACNFSLKRLKRFHKDKKLKVVEGNFKNLKELAMANGFKNARGILFDLGFSSWQLEHSGRGFSFQKCEPLDMRMDPSLSVRAEDLINGLSEGELYELFRRLGEESLARIIAVSLVRTRRLKKITDTKQLSELIISVYEKKYGFGNKRKKKIYPATKVFQALRIAVNSELENLKKALPQTVEVLKKEGRLVVISFHSLEDRIVKNFFKENKKKSLEILTQKPVLPKREEIRNNFRSRSALLRVASKI